MPPTKRDPSNDSRKKKADYHLAIDLTLLTDAQIRCLKEGRMPLNYVIEELLKLWLNDKAYIPPYSRRE